MVLRTWKSTVPEAREIPVPVAFEIPPKRVQWSNQIGAVEVAVIEIPVVVRESRIVSSSWKAAAKEPVIPVTESCIQQDLQRQFNWAFAVVIAVPRYEMISALTKESAPEVVRATRFAVVLVLTNRML
jgi:hypothetical protein